MIAVGIGVPYCFQLFDHSGSMGSVVPKEMTSLHEKVAERGGAITIAFYGHPGHSDGDYMWFNKSKKKINLAKDIAPVRSYHGDTGCEATKEAIALSIEWMLENVPKNPFTEVSFFVFGDGSCDTSVTGDERCKRLLVQARALGWNVRFISSAYSKREIQRIYGFESDEVMERFR